MAGAGRLKLILGLTGKNRLMPRFGTVDEPFAEIDKGNTRKIIHAPAADLGRRVGHGQVQDVEMAVSAKTKALRTCWRPLTVGIFCQFSDRIL